MRFKLTPIECISNVRFDSFARVCNCDEGALRVRARLKINDNFEWSVREASFNGVVDKIA